MAETRVTSLEALLGTVVKGLDVWVGEHTAEAYAFSDDGLMLTPSRFAEELIAAGVLTEAAAGSSAFLILVRDPGGNLAAGHSPALEPAAHPLTQPAALTVAARGKATESDQRGAVSMPYRRYHGNDVIGVLRWLPAYDVGVIAEISTLERQISEGRMATIYLAGTRC